MNTNFNPILGGVFVLPILGGGGGANLPPLSNSLLERARDLIFLHTDSSSPKFLKFDKKIGDVITVTTTSSYYLFFTFFLKNAVCIAKL